MRVIKADIKALSEKKIDALGALVLYHRFAQYLLRESIRYIDLVAKDEADFHMDARPWHALWVSSVYVVHEGMVYLDVQDAKLNQIRAQGTLMRLGAFAMPLSITSQTGEILGTRP